MLSEFKFHHLGIAVHNIDETANYYVESGYEKSEPIYDNIQNVKICFLKKKGMPTLELIAPVNENSPINQTLNKMGVTPYHCCYSVNDLDNAVKRLKTKKYIVLAKPVEACALGGKRICFLFNNNVGLIELVEI